MHSPDYRGRGHDARQHLRATAQCRAHQLTRTQRIEFEAGSSSSQNRPRTVERSLEDACLMLQRNARPAAP